MNVALWVAQVLLAVVFAGAGGAKLALSPAKLSSSLGDWIDGIPGPAVKLLGAVEVAAALGLVVPPLVNVAPALTPLAAVGAALVMFGAIVVHARRREFPNVAVNAVLLVAAVVVAWGRFGPYAF